MDLTANVRTQNNADIDVVWTFHLIMEICYMCNFTS